MRVVVGTYELVVRSVYSFVQEEGFTMVTVNDEPSRQMRCKPNEKQT